MLLNILNENCCSLKIWNIDWIEITKMVQNKYRMGGDERDAEIRDYLTISFFFLFKILFIRELEFFSTNVNKEKIHLRFSFEQRFSAFSKFLSVLT